MPSDERTERQRTARDLLIIALISVLIVAWAGTIFFLIGDKPRDWDYGAHKSIPGESYQSTEPVGKSAEPPPQVELPPPEEPGR